MVGCSRRGALLNIELAAVVGHSEPFSARFCMHGHDIGGELSTARLALICVGMLLGLVGLDTRSTRIMGGLKIDLF